jgi:hypothetical protein
VFDADQLVLLKSVGLPDGADLEQATRQGIVDEYFASEIRSMSLNVLAIENLRSG